MSKPAGPLPPWSALVYLALLAAGVPWYWPDGDETLVLGIPAWVAMAIAVALVVAIFSAWLLSRRWPGESDGDD
ncbi:MAG: hypothetical protein IT495_00865 [Gammaproteobacteria bacterium]|nr:hypothetical protein [Gammaproteobacteria bacterium]